MTRRAVGIVTVASAMMLGACAGVYVGIPVGPVQVGTSVSPDGDVGVHAGVSTPAGSVGVSGKVPKQQGPFTDLPAEADGHDKREKDRENDG